MTQTAQQVITTIATQDGIPPSIPLTIAYTESGLNPNKIGDNGTSFGLFQLHRGGQAGTLAQNQLLNPTINARVGIRAMLPAYKAGVSQGLTGFPLTEYVANHSGHPNYLGRAWVNQNDPAYNAQLQTAYDHMGGITGGKAAPPSMQTTSVSNGTLQLMHQLDEGMKIKGGINLLNPAANAGAIGLRIALVLIGLLLFVVGLIKTVGAQNAAATAATLIK